MRRADRLFQIIELLRAAGRGAAGRGAALTARQLGTRLGVSERTVYRDIADLIASGTPIEGEAGVGYLLRRGFDLPPIMFDGDEIEAVVAGMHMVRAAAGSNLGEAAGRVLAKVEAVLPRERRGELARARVLAPGSGPQRALAERLETLRDAVHRKACVQLDYTREDGATSRRVVQPLVLMYWPPNWLLGGYCELRQDFRSFRLDRMRDCTVLARRFDELPGRGFDDFMRAMRAE